jgi:hypothetical protein
METTRVQHKEDSANMHLDKASKEQGNTPFANTHLEATARGVWLPRNLDAATLIGWLCAGLHSEALGRLG